MFIFLTELFYSPKGHLFTVSAGCIGSPVPFIQVETSIKTKKAVTCRRHKSGSAVGEIKQIPDFKAILIFVRVITHPITRPGAQY